MSEDVRDEELKKEDEALKAKQAGGKDQASETGETKEMEASNDTPETQEDTPDEIEETEGTEESTEQASADGKEERKGFFKKKKNPRDEKVEKPADRVKRQMTGFGNFRRRTDKGKLTMCKMGAKDIIERILPVIDNLERDLATVPEDAKETPLAEGMEKIYKQFRKTLEETGVKAIGAVGWEFDPNYHNAVTHVGGDSLGENIAAEELQKGYMYRNSIVGHNMVKMAN